MESDNTITSPPYPAPQVTSRGLYRHLSHFRNWLVEQQETIRFLLPSRLVDQLKTPDNLADETIWDNISVVDKYTVFATLRRIREAWDHIIREHDETWDSKLSLQKRFGVLQMATQLMAEAFVDPERREAREATAARRMQKQMRIMHEHLRKVLIPPELQDMDKTDDIAGDLYGENDDQDSNPDDDWGQV